MAGMRADRLEEEGTAASPTELQRPPTPGQQPSSSTQDRPQQQAPAIDIMHLINMVSSDKHPVASEGIGLCTTGFRITHSFTIGGRTLRLIDSPGFYTTSLSVPDIMKRLILYLIQFRNSKGAPNLSAILYLHPEEKDIGDENLRRTMEALRHLVGDPWLPSVTIAVIGDGATTGSDAITQLQEPTSPFYSLYSGGANILPLSFELPRIQEVLLGIEPCSSLPRFFGKTSWNSRDHCPTGINELIEEIMGPSRKEHPVKTWRQRRITLEESETSRQLLQATLDATETELKLSRSQIAQIQEEYASLRSELQLHDNTEQSKVVQSLQDLNRAIDNFGRSVAEYMFDNFAPTLNKDDPTTLDASDFPALQRQFGHREGNSSLAVSLGGNALPIEDFIDLGLRNFLCEKLYSDVFIPFHPSATSAGPDFMTPLYEEVRRQGPSVVAAKWRACTFMALSKGNQLDKPAIEGHVENLIKEQIQPLFDNLFGQSNSVALTDAQRGQLQDVITVAWELNHVLKGEVVTLGDFLPLCCERGVPFDPKTMVEFEASKKRKPGSIAICTIRLGLSLSYAKGSGKGSGPSVDHHVDEPLYPPNFPTPTNTMSYDGSRGSRGHHNTRSRGGRGGRSGGSGRGYVPFNSETRTGPRPPNDRPSSNQNPTNAKAATTAPNSVSNYSGINSAKAKDAITGIPILILGTQGCGKSSLINVFFNKPAQKISNRYEPGTKDFHPIGIRTANHDFTLIDSPGFDNTLMSDIDIFTKLIQFLCRDTPPTMIAGVIYLHAQGTRLGSGALAKNLHFIKYLLGDSFLERLTILLVSQPGERVDHQKLVDPLLDPKSPFYALYASGAQPDVAALEKNSISKILLSYVGKPPMLMGFQNELCRERVPTEEGINSYLTRCARAKEGGSTTISRSRLVAGALSLVHTQDFLSPAERKKLESKLQELKRQNEEGSSQSQQDLSQYTALLSQLQIHDNFEQKDVVQSLLDLNRHIDDFALSLSLYLTDTYGGPNIPTTQHAFNLPQLKQLFEHEEGKASLVQSSTGEGMPLEDFLDVAIRSTLCEQLYKRIFGPFHPGLDILDPKNGYIVALYTRIRETETPATLGRWRTASFNAISGLTGEQGLSRLKDKVRHGILNEHLMPMLQHLFGPDKEARLKDAHLKDLSALVEQAWDWCLVLKEKIVLLGDFQLAAYRYGRAFDSTQMTEFEPRKGAPPPDRILSTIGLGLNVGNSQSGGGRDVLCKASVVTEGWFERP